MDNGQKVKKDYIRRAKGLLLQCKRITFGGQKDSFYNAKGLHLEGKRTTFEKEKDFATSRGNNRYLAREQKKGSSVKCVDACRVERIALTESVK